MVTPIPEGGDWGAPRLVVPPPCERRFAHLAWPKIVRLPDGTLVLGCLAGEAHTRGGSPVVAVSEDGGRSFSAPAILERFGPDKPFVHSGNIALGVAADGAVVLLAMALSGDAERTTIIGRRSEDGGWTWEATDTSQLAGRAGSVYGHVFAVPGRGLAVAGHYRAGSTPVERGIWLTFSDDDGRSWGAPRTISRSLLHEPALCYTQGRLIGLVRDNPARCYRQVVSPDMGATWEETVSQVGGGTRLPSPFITPVEGHPGALFALHTERNEGEEPGAIYLWEASAQRLQWRRRGLVARFPERGDYGYPWMAQLDDGRWFLVLYCGAVEGPSAIWGLELAVAPQL